VSDSTSHSENSSGAYGGADLGRVGTACKQILNVWEAMAIRSATRRRFAALTVSQLDDIGLTIAERDDLLR
jgi:hypothetical protein